MKTTTVIQQLQLGTIDRRLAICMSQPDVLWAAIAVIGGRYNLDNRMVSDGKLYELRSDVWPGYSSLDKIYDDIDIENFAPTAFRLISDTPTHVELESYATIRDLRMMALIIEGRAIRYSADAQESRHYFAT